MDHTSKRYFHDESTEFGYRIFNATDGNRYRAEATGLKMWKVYLYVPDSNAFRYDGTVTVKKSQTPRAIFEAYLKESTR